MGDCTCGQGGLMSKHSRWTVRGHGGLKDVDVGRWGSMLGRKVMLCHWF